MTTMFVITYTHGAYSDRVDGNVCLFSNQEMATSFVNSLNVVVADIRETFDKWKEGWSHSHPTPVKPQLTGSKSYRSKPCTEWLMKMKQHNSYFELDKNDWFESKFVTYQALNITDEIRAWIKYNWYDLEFGMEELSVVV